MKDIDLMVAAEKKKRLEAMKQELKLHKDNLKLEMEIAQTEQELSRFKSTGSIKTWLQSRGLLKPFVLIVLGIIMVDVGEAIQYLYLPLVGILILGFGVWQIPYVHDFLADFFEE